MYCFATVVAAAPYSNVPRAYPSYVLVLVQIQSRRLVVDGVHVVDCGRYVKSIGGYGYVKSIGGDLGAPEPPS